MEGSAIISGDGYAVAPDLDSLGEGYGFRKVRKQLGVSALGANVIVMPPGYAAPLHYHDEQEELYFVHRGVIEIAFGDGSKQRIDEGGAACVDASTHRQVRNPSDRGRRLPRRRRQGRVRGARRAHARRV